MKKDKEWLKEKVQTMIDEEYRCYDPLIQHGKHTCRVIMDLIDQLDEPRKPVIPQFVADYIERWKGDDLSLNGWFTFDYDNDGETKVAEWLMVDINDETKRHREFTLIDAIRYGYEVEKEKKYYVDLGTAAYVAKWGGDGSVQIYTDSISGSDEYEFHLTEKEIKDYDERYWAFAEEVEE